VPEEGSSTSSKVLFLQKGLLKTISSNTSPYNPILAVSGLQKNAKNAQNAHKKGQNRFLALEHGRLRGFGPYYSMT